MWRIKILGLLSAVVLSSPAWASVTLSVRVLRGGLDLDFGMVEPGRASETQELELALTSTGAGQYRLYQECQGFLVSERNTRLPDGALLMQISRGTAGMPATGAIMPVTETPQELYVSGANGQSDTVLLSYSIPARADLPAGRYRGVCRFTVESRDTGAIVAQTITVRASVAAVTGLERPAGVSSALRLGSVGPGERSAEVEFPVIIRNNAATTVTLMQELAEPLSNAQGQSLPVDAVNYMVSSAQGAEPWRPMADHPERVISDDRGELRQCRLRYAVSIPADQRAGWYRGGVRLRLLSGTGATADEWIVPIEVEVREVFTVSVAIVDGGEAMQFSRSASGGSVTEHAMQVTVTTNMGKPYQVLGGLDHPLVLPSGETLPRSSLVWSIPEIHRGKPLLAANTPVAIGLEPVYASDADGSSESFLLRYRMSIPEDARDGVYSGRMHFTVTVF